MRSICTLLAALLWLSSPGSSVLTRSGEASKPADWGPPEFQRLARSAYRLLQAGRIDQAAATFEKGYSAALQSRNDKAAIRFLTALAGCRFAQYRYREAIQSYSAAQAKAVTAGDYAQAALCALNASSIYAQMQNVRAAGQAASDALQWLAHTRTTDQQAQVLLQLGWVASLQNRSKEALALYRQAIQYAKARQDPRAEALGWHRLGAELLEHKQLAQAEAALNQAYRLRIESHDPRIDASYRNLAELKLAQGDYPGAEQYANRALALPPSRLHVPAHRVLDLRGRIRLARGDFQGALADFRAALRDVKVWSTEVLPADSFRISTESMLAELYSGRIQAAAELYFLTHDSRYLVESWQAADANRAASLRARIMSANYERLPAEYWEVLAQLHSIESRLVAAQPERSAELRSQADALRFRLTRLEMSVGISSPRVDSQENFLTGISLKQFREVLGNSRKLISFHLGEKTSYRWVIGPSETELQRLPGREQIAALAKRLRSEVQKNEPGALATGRRLYSLLFGGISLNPRHWLLALDGELFEAPLAALVRDNDNQPVYVAECVALETVPGAWAVGDRMESPRNGPFVALGDPVYNTADERLQSSERNAVVSRVSRTRSGAALELPRLVGSGAEIAACSRTWTRAPSILLTGESATAERLRAALERRPSIIHVAAHFIRGGDDENRTVIALALRPGLNSKPVPEVLTAADISTMPAAGALVVMSGCSSGLGHVRAASGVLGLARAWLAAGARAVVSSQWPVPDDTGELFQSFYRRLNEAAQKGDRLAPAEALRRAQVDMLTSHTWRSETSYWAAYGILGRSN
jgi:CHAT domain-containing protein